MSTTRRWTSTTYPSDEYYVSAGRVLLVGGRVLHVLRPCTLRPSTTYLRRRSQVCVVPSVMTLNGEVPVEEPPASSPADTQSRTKAGGAVAQDDAFSEGGSPSCSFASSISGSPDSAAAALRRARRSAFSSFFSRFFCSRCRLVTDGLGVGNAAASLSAAAPRGHCVFPGDPTGSASYHRWRDRDVLYWLPCGSAGSSGEICGGFPRTMSPTRNPAPREDGMAWASSLQFIVSRIRWRANAVSHSPVTRVR